MKKLLIIFLSCFCFSCTDWLNLTSENAVTLTGYFKNEKDLEAWMYSIFSNERWIDASPKLYQMEYAGLSCTHAGYYEDYRRLDPVFCLDGRNMMSWVINYQIIYMAEVLIENRHRFENVSESRADFWVAQANFARAYAYFDLARRWGDAPVSKGSESTEALPKSPVEDVLGEAIRYAEEALILPKYDELRDAYGAAITSKQYASLGSVHTLLANIYAWMGGLYGERTYWEKAEEHASFVIDGKAGAYNLEGDIASMLQNCLGKTRNSQETIFNIEINEIDEDYTTSTGFMMTYPGMALISYPYQPVNPQDLETDVENPKITVEDVAGIFPDLRDQRRKEYWYKLGEVTYENASQETVVSKYAFLNKWNDPIYQTNPDMADTYTGVVAMEGNRIIWRLADLILLRAECRARLGVATAKDDLDRVRGRAGLGKYDGSTDPEILRKEIFRERERELFGEGQRYFDIVRNGYFRDELLGNYKLLTNEDVKNGALYLPVHKNSFVKNVYMKQNTYWLWQK